MASSSGFLRGGHWFEPWFDPLVGGGMASSLGFLGGGGH